MPQARGHGNIRSGVTLCLLLAREDEFYQTIVSTLDHTAVCIVFSLGLILTLDKIGLITILVPYQGLET